MSDSSVDRHTNAAKRCSSASQAEPAAKVAARQSSNADDAEAKLKAQLLARMSAKSSSLPGSSRNSSNASPTVEPSRLTSSTSPKGTALAKFHSPAASSPLVQAVESSTATEPLHSEKSETDEKEVTEDELENAMTTERDNIDMAAKTKYVEVGTPPGEDVQQPSSPDNVVQQEADSATQPEQRIEQYYPAEGGCRHISVYERLNRIDEGTYGVVFRAKDKSTGIIRAVKRLKMEKEREGFPITSLREINTMLKVRHENIVQVQEIVIGDTMDEIFIIMEFVAHDVKALLENLKQPLLQAEVKCLMVQLLRGVGHLHDNWLLHRDLKTSNLLLSHDGILKIADFGLAREYGDPLRKYTSLVVTLWYRAPELLLGAESYSTAIDMWSVGCIFAELLTRKPLLPGNGEIDTLNKMFKLLGVPNEDRWHGFNDLPLVKKITLHGPANSSLPSKFGRVLPASGVDLMASLLDYDPVAVRNQSLMSVPQASMLGWKCACCLLRTALCLLLYFVLNMPVHTLVCVHSSRLYTTCSSLVCVHSFLA
eukprot:TRINITY_DN9339_c0_g1_i1.p1 TRINITY_DN9339_c0_g1~~TRINITY_DN9339_c0_g1_i1.p1  ORF type:complete len:539 (+),score=104.90 TRINITY_DN9339_c0_g1_i1:1609-3225(+)